MKIYLKSFIATLITLLTWYSIFVFRFSLTTIPSFGILELYLVITFFLIFISIFKMLEKLERNHKWIWIAFGIAFPFSIFGALVGGLLGGIGIVLFTILPMVFTVLPTYLILRTKTTKTPTKQETL